MIDFQYPNDPNMNEMWNFCSIGNLTSTQNFQQKKPNQKKFGIFGFFHNIYGKYKIFVKIYQFLQAFPSLMEKF